LVKKEQIKERNKINLIKKHWLIILITLIGGLYRFYYLGYNPLWIDEALFYYYIKNGANQEFLTVFINMFLPTSEFWLRFPSAFFGTLSIPAIYFVIEDKKAALFAASFIAFCPLMVFWSRMARPYSVAAFFVILGWKYRYFYIASVLTTPYALLGLNLTKVKDYKFYIIIVALAALSFMIRPDSNRSFFNLEFILNAKRLWVIPFVSCCLYFFDVVIPFAKHRHSNIKQT
jgi:predicted membrane-bound mannosyltransferase